MRPTKDLLYLHRWMFEIVLQLILQKCTAFSNVISSHTPYQTLTLISISGGKCLAVVFQCSTGNYSYMLLADNKPVISRNKPKLVLMWHSLSSRFLIHHFNTNISTKGGGVLGGSKSTALKTILLRRNNQNYIQSCSIILELQKLCT